MPIDATDGPGSTKAGAPVEPKTFASGRFVVQCLLGEGGQKTVYLARDTQLARNVAIGSIKTHGLDEAGIARVRREAQTLAGLGAQPHIVTMYDIGQEAAPDGRPVPYLSARRARILPHSATSLRKEQTSSERGSAMRPGKR